MYLHNEPKSYLANKIRNLWLYVYLRKRLGKKWDNLQVFNVRFLI